MDTVFLLNNFNIFREYNKQNNNYIFLFTLIYQNQSEIVRFSDRPTYVQPNIEYPLKIPKKTRNDCGNGFFTPNTVKYPGKKY